jgi:hypothetical protein
MCYEREFFINYMQGLGLLKCFKNIIHCNFLGSFWNLISHKATCQMCDYENVKLQSCNMEQAHHKNIEIFMQINILIIFTKYLFHIVKYLLYV